jgi:serine/threonine protein kinase
MSARMPDRMPEELIGGRYRVIDCLRKTGFCETYIAEDKWLPDNPHCVVKKLQPQSNEQFILETARRLFISEAKVLYRLSDHPQIPRLLAHLEVGEQFYLVQEFIEGKDLGQAEIVPGKHWSEEEVIAFLQEVLEILAFVHQNRVIHRDIKPSNLIRRIGDGKIVLIDFGAVKEITNMTLTEGEGRLLTVAVGTPSYMPSEQQRGDPRFNSDIYALGMTAIQAITGVNPDQLPRDYQTGEICWRDYAPNCRPALGNLLDKMVRNDFRERYQNVNDVLEDLQKLNRPVRKPFDSRSKPPFKRFILFALLPLALGFIFLGPRILAAIQAINYYNQGNQFIKEDKYEEAIAAFDNALEIKPNFAEAWTNRGFALGKTQRFLEKFASCAQATRVQPDFAEAWNCRGLARFDLQQYESALEEYNRAIAVEPKFQLAWFNKGQVLLQLGKNEEAIAATQRVIALKPDFALAWTQMCRALYQLQRFGEARDYCQESLRIQPGHQPTIQLLKQVQSKLGN